jgi:hypothetical protein
VPLSPGMVRSDLEMLVLFRALTTGDLDHNAKVLLGSAKAAWLCHGFKPADAPESGKEGKRLESDEQLLSKILKFAREYKRCPDHGTLFNLVATSAFNEGMLNLVEQLPELEKADLEAGNVAYMIDVAFKDRRDSYICALQGKASFLTGSKGPDFSQKWFAQQMSYDFQENGPTELDWEEDTEQVSVSTVQLEQLLTAPPSPLEFPADALYGRLGQAARLLKVPLGLAYPAILAVASALGPRDTGDNVRSNLYVCNIAGVGTGKSVALKRALQSVFLPEGCVIKSAGSSDRGMIKILGDTGSTQILAQDEFRHMMSKMATPGSGIGLTAVACQLWSDNNAGAADKHGNEECDARLSILGNLPCATPNEFAKIFGTETTKGLADRFIYGYADEKYDYRPAIISRELYQVRPVEITYPGPVWTRVDAWKMINDRRDTRLGENAMRVALVTAACNGETVIGDECLTAALSFMEWQEKLRGVFKPGMAENPEAEAMTDIADCLFKHLQQQLAANIVPAGGEDVRDLNWTKILNSGSFYRKYGVTLINRVKKGLLEEGIIAEIKKAELDESGRGGGKQVKTRFVRLRRKLA